MSKSANEVVDENVWCMCFVIFKEDTLEGTGAEWLPCPCRKLLHENCAEDCIVDSRVESGSDDPDYLGHLGHFLVGQVGLIYKQNYLYVTRVSHVL